MIFFVKISIVGCSGLRAIKQVKLNFPVESTFSSTSPFSIDIKKYTELYKAIEFADYLLCNKYGFALTYRDSVLVKSHLGWTYGRLYSKSNTRLEGQIFFSYKRGQLEVVLFEWIGWRVKGSKYFRQVFADLRKELKEKFGEDRVT